jgi:pantothenate kinase
LFDLTVFLSLPLAKLERRLVQRWLDQGFDLAAATERASGNDMQNARLVVGKSSVANFTLTE